MKIVLYKIIIPIRKLYWFVFRPKTKGVKVVIECDGEVLMIKNTYGQNVWTFPGGAVEKNELPESAAKREVMEEVGIKVFELKIIGEIFNTREYKKDTIYCYLTKVNNKVVKNDVDEIKELKWFNKNEFPDEISSIAKEVMLL